MNLINREALMFSLVFSDETGSIPCGQMKAILEVVKAQPLAQPEIIRCQYCKYGEFPAHNVRCSQFYGAGCYNGFCAWGEKK